MGTRGFAKPGDYNSRILLLVNGHRVNDNVFGQAEIGAEFGLDPAMFERVEIIRGPASSLYGDSAFFAVVNVITRTGASLGGGAVTVETGTLGTRLLRASAGHRFASGLDVALSGTYEHSDGVQRLYYPEFDSPATNDGVAEGLDGEGVKQVYGRLSFGDITLTGAYGTRGRDVPTASFGTLFNEQISRERTTDRHTLFDAEYGRTFNGTRLTLRGSFDRFSYDGTYPFDDGSPSPLVGINNVIGTRWTADAGVTRALRGKQTVRAGIEFIENMRQDQTAGYVGYPELSLDSKRSSTQHAVYIQDEIRPTTLADPERRAALRRLRPVLPLHPAHRRDRHALDDTVVQIPVRPRLPGAERIRAEYVLLRRSGGEPPARIDRHARTRMGALPQRLAAHLGLDLLVQRQPADHLGPDDPSEFLGVTSATRARCGRRVSSSRRRCGSSGGSQALVSYALQEAVDQETGSELPNSPRHMTKARFSVPGPSDRSFVAVEALYLSSRKPVSGARVPGAATLNITLTQPLGQSWELFGGFRNLFNVDYSDPASAQHLQTAIPQNGAPHASDSAGSSGPNDIGSACRHSAGCHPERGGERSLRRGDVAVLRGPGHRRPARPARSQLRPAIPGLLPRAAVPAGR